jgi:hypothetical protein
MIPRARDGETTARVTGFRYMSDESGMPAALHDTNVTPKKVNQGEAKW